MKPVGRIFEISDLNPVRRKCGKRGRPLSPYKNKGLRRLHRAKRRKTQKMRKMRKMRKRKRGKCGKCGWLALLWLAWGDPHEYSGEGTWLRYLAKWVVHRPFSIQCLQLKIEALTPSRGPEVEAALTPVEIEQRRLKAFEAKLQAMRDAAMLMAVSKRWFEFCQEIKFPYPSNLNLTTLLLFLYHRCQNYDKKTSL